MKKLLFLISLLTACQFPKSYTLINGEINGKAYVNKYGSEYKRIETYENNKLVKMEEVWDGKGNKELLPKTSFGNNGGVIFDTFIHYKGEDPIIGLYKLDGKEVLLRCEVPYIIEFTSTSPKWNELKKSGFKCPEK